MMLAKALASASASAAKIYVEDVFSTWLYTGTGSTQTITNGIDLSGKGGLVWLKHRASSVLGSAGHFWCDTVRGRDKSIDSDDTAGNDTVSSTRGITSFNSDGFSLGTDINGKTNYPSGNTTYASWTFRKAPKFFDVVTYTGNGSNRTIAHSLGSVPGTIIVKRTDTSADWQVYHRSLANTEYLVLNSTAAKATGTTRWNSTTPTSSVFSLGTDTTVNASGGTYVAYLFAHDAGGFGDSGSDSVVSCGTFTGTGEVNLGWEPQFLLFKRTDSTSNWFVIDNMRGFSRTEGVAVYTNLSNAEANALGAFMPPTATGFINNAYGGTWIYIAIRRGPMKTPTDATSIFNTYQTSTSRLTGDKYDSNLYPPDLYIWFKQSAGGGAWWQDRLRGWKSLTSRDLNAELGTTYITQSGKQDELEYIGNWDNATGYANWFFRRAPGFFDVVAYTGNGSTTHDVSHNLGVPPEIIITKRRDAQSTTGWFTSSKYYYNTSLWDRNGRLNDGTTGLSGGDVYGPDTYITATQFRIRVNNADINASGGTYIAYLFATCPGVSKCGGYTGTGTTLNIDCGFTNGARFVLIKRADAAGDWYVWDTARGIVSGNDPYLLINSTAAEVTSTDYIDPLSSGFQISSTAPAAINANGGSFIFLAIA